MPGSTAWNDRYETRHTPWDLGCAHPELIDRIPTLGEPGLAYVGGSGRGHDAIALAAAGWKVTATDFAPSLADDVGPRLAATGGRFVVTDSLGFESEPFDLIFEHTFFCAIDPADRNRYGAMARRLLRPGGTLAAVVFPIGKGAGGPPWPITTATIDSALGEAFELRSDEPIENRTGSAWRSRWAEWVRR